MTTTDAHHVFRLSSFLFLAGLAALVRAQGPAPLPPRLLTRVFFQDDDASAVKWVDVVWGQPATIGRVNSVEGFPKLDKERQSLAQMRAVGGMLLVN